MGVGLLQNVYICGLKKDTVFVVRSKNLSLLKIMKIISCQNEIWEKVMSSQRTVDSNQMRRQNSQKRAILSQVKLGWNKYMKSKPSKEGDRD